MLVSLWIDLFAGLTAGSRFVSVCDAVGEKLAWWLGITSPKYYYEIQEAIRCKVSQSINWNNQPFERKIQKRKKIQSGWTLLTEGQTL